MCIDIFFFSLINSLKKKLSELLCAARYCSKAWSLWQRSGFSPTKVPHLHNCSWQTFWTHFIKYLTVSSCVLKIFVTGHKVLTNTFCKIPKCLLFNFLFTSCAQKRNVAKIFLGQRLDYSFLIRCNFLVISKTMHISKYFH